MIRKLAIIFTVLFLSISFICPNVKVVYADKLSDSILDQLENIDLTEFDKYYQSLEFSDNGMDAYSIIVSLLNGNYSSDYQSVFEYLLSSMLGKVKSYLPALVSIMAIALFCGIMQNLRSGLSSEGVSDIIFFVCFSSIILLLAKIVIGFYNDTKVVIGNLSNLSNAVSPIILTLMTAVGANVSAAVYTPTVTFLSGTIINLATTILLPLIGLVAIFSVTSSLTTNLRLNKFADCVNSIIKWIIGITITIFTIFISVQGITSATYDGVSIKAAKYTISNSIPIVGGFLKDGFDLVVAGSVLIKNAVGVSAVFALFYTILTPVINMLVFSLLLKFVCAVTESISDVRVSNVCMSIVKFITYLNAIILIVGLMFFIVMLLMLFSANAFI